MPEDNVTRRRRALLVDVTQAASEVSRLATKPAISTCQWSLASATAMTPWFAGPSCSQTSSPKPASNR
jgi:hypothetical protein